MADGHSDVQATTTAANTEKPPVSMFLSIPGKGVSVTSSEPSPDDLISPLAGKATPPAFSRQHTLDFDDYFKGPRDITKHSKWPFFLRMHGGIMPRLILPLILVALWSTAITVISKKVHMLGVNSVLLTVLGFVISLALSFRNSTAYERYTEGRKSWGSLVLASQALGRVFWIHAVDNPDLDARESKLKKLSCMNLVVAYAVALKHSLRFEPFTAYPDLQHLVGHLNTFAKDATNGRGDDAFVAPKKGFFKGVGEYLGVSFAASNPRKILKRSDKPLGNLPLEILNHLAVAIDHLVTSEQLKVPMHQTLAYNNLGVLNDVMTTCDRVLNTPLPIAYTIVVSQITYLYVLVLPFQMVKLLDWITIPASIFATYVILGFLFIGEEIENPFGQDVNDLPLEGFCDQITSELDIIASYDMRNPLAFFTSSSNMPLYPTSTASAGTWMHRSEEKLNDMIRTKPSTIFKWRKEAGQLEPKAAEHMV